MHVWRGHYCPRRDGIIATAKREPNRRRRGRVLRSCEQIRPVVKVRRLRGVLAACRNPERSEETNSQNHNPAGGEDKGYFAL
jgi:hypothetical protein